MFETLEYLVFLAFVLLLLLLRLDAHRFGTAEYDDESGRGGWRAFLRRLSWYAMGTGLVLVAFYLYQQPISQLHLDLGADRQRAIVLGLAFGAGGTAFAFAFAWLRYRRFRLPPASQYAGAVINSVGTSFLDEALFRGIVMGLLIAYGWPAPLALAFQAILYALATRLGAPGRSRVMLLISLGVGVVSGLLVLDTGGIGAAILGHAVTRFAIFLSTGHAGQMRPAGWEPEEEAGYGLPPSGWEFAGDDVSEPSAAEYGTARPG
jgi:Type II CAAX prenyl endopeptidase Rce1-like